LVVVDVGYCFDLYADFSGSGKNYVPFPDPRSFRIHLDRLRDDKVRKTLRDIWLDPHSLDPSKHAAEVTREIATRLAKLAKSLESEHEPEVVAGFLMRCLFTMFAEDAELIRKDSFSELLLSLRYEIHNFQPMVESLWEAMDLGKFSIILREKLKRFNGKFFKDKTALPLNRDQLQLLIEASLMNWQYVEPSIFGTLLERALDPVERHKLGAHFTPRAYVERLVMPTIIEPLREEWDATYASAVQLDEEGKRKDAVKLLRDFHSKLCSIRILDPACGSGNFLYVAMELLKRLEGEVVSAMASFGEHVLPGITIDPHQFLGIELNPRAAAIAELVLWIGFIQWHRRTRLGTMMLEEPILKDYGNIECRDAVLAWDSIEPVFDDQGKPVTRWDGRTTKPHPVTGEEVPDENARVQEVRYINPRKAEWPAAHFVVGNPPFLGKGERMRADLGNGYVDAIRLAYAECPGGCDFVMYWWKVAGDLLRNNRIQRFGFITTNSISYSMNRRIILPVLEDGCSIVFAVPDHPWVDSQDGADVRIAMTVAIARKSLGLVEIAPAGIVEKRYVGEITAALKIGANVSDASQLQSNSNLSFNGVMLRGSGFIIDNATADRFIDDSDVCREVIRKYRNGKDLAQKPRLARVIDFCGVSEEQARLVYPSLYQHVLVNVKPERDSSSDRGFRENWWVFGRTRPALRAAMLGLSDFIATPETTKNRFFTLLNSEILPDHMIVAITLSDRFQLGVLSSSPHVKWSLTAGGRLGIGNDPRYNKSVCFETFPFPETSHETKKRIANLAEQLDAHRKRQQEQHPTLTMTGMYNVLEKLRSGEPLTAKERMIHDQGLVSVLKQIHDDLDAAVFDAYGWPHDLADEDILQRLVDLNHERAEEESRGIIRWLRPEFQNPAHGQAPPQDVQGDLELEIEIEDEDEDAKPTKKATATKVAKLPWPKTLPERMVAIQSALQRHGGPADSKQIASSFTRANKADVALLLETLTAVGIVRQLEDGRFAAYK
jgi:hypothetical protein